MSSPTSHLSEKEWFQKLREKARSILTERQDDRSREEMLEIDQMIEELQVYQTELEAQQEELVETQDRLRSVVERYTELYHHAPVGYISIGPNGSVLEFNRTFKQMLKLEKSNVIGIPLINFILKDDFETYISFQHRLFKKRETTSCEVRIKAQKGYHFWCKLEGKPRIDHHQSAETAQIALINIDRMIDAEMKLRSMNEHLEATVEERTEELAYRNQELRNKIDELQRIRHSLQESESRFRLLVDNIPGAAIFLVDNRRQILLANGSDLRTILAAEENVTGKKLHRVLPLPDPPEFARLLEEVLQDNPRKEIFALNGRMYETRFIPLTDNLSELKHCIVFFMDITERLEHERQIQEREQRFRTLFDFSPDPILLADPETGTITDANLSAEKVLGIPRDELTGIPHHKLYPPDELQRVQAIFASRQQDNDHLHPVEVTILKGDGSTLDVELRDNFIEIDGNRLLMGNFRDISERKEAERRLSESENRFRTLYENAPLMILGADKDDRLILWNSSCEENLGWTQEEIGTATNLFRYAFGKKALEYRRQFVENRGVFLELDVSTKHGENRTQLWTSYLLPDQSRIAIGYDITEQRKAAQEKKKVETQFQTMFEESDIGMAIADHNGRIERVNRCMAELYLLTEDDLLGLNLIELVPDNEDESISPVLHGETEMVSNQTRVLRNDGSSFWGKVLLTRVESPQSGQSSFMLIIEDIDERKRARDELKKNRNLLHSVLNGSMNVITAVESIRDEQGKIVDFRFILANAQARNLLGIDSEDLMERRALDTFPGVVEDKLFDRFVHTVETGEPVDVEHHYKHEELDIWVRLIAVKLGDGLVVTLNDIRPQKEAQQQIEHDARMKDILLEEVNHRVKNNLASIIGMLAIEKDRNPNAKNKQTIEFINDLIGRIQGLSVVHELLSGSRWEPIPLDYLLRSIVESCLATHPDGHRTRFRVEDSKIMVNAVQSHNLAMIFSELVNNSFKHCKKPPQALVLDIQLPETDKDEISIRYKDNGPGYPEETMKTAKGNVGFYIMTNLIKSELHGSYQFFNDTGAGIDIRFPIQNENF